MPCAPTVSGTSFPERPGDILNCIDRAVQRWLDPHSPERQQAETRLPETTGLSAAMIRHVLPLYFSGISSGQDRSTLR